MQIIDKIRQLAKTNIKTIVFPEGEEERIIKAASFLRNNALIKPILLGDIDLISNNAHDLNLELGDIEIINPLKSDFYTDYVEKYYELRKHKNMDLEQAKETIKNPLFFGAFMVREEIADGAVAGSINPTGNVLRAAIQVVGLAPEVSIVSSSFLMALKNEKILTFADCAVIPEPDVEELVSIAISSAYTHKKIIEEEPRIAMLSFSTKGSAQHPIVEKVIQATTAIQGKEPELKIDGELQFDAAYLEAVGQKKAPESSVAGRANVYIFPDLNSGNIAYKIAQRLADAEAIGPIIQGLKKPYNDLSRGCSVDDVINVACICSILS